MPTIFSGINVALRAMLTHQQAIEVIEHNVANANTAGYRRQEAVLRAGTPYTYPGLNRPATAGQLGTGVLVESIRRFNVDFFDGRYRREVSEASRWTLHSEILDQVEATLAETSSDGLIPALDALWSGWQALSSDPSNTALRVGLVQSAASLTQALNRRSLQLHDLRRDQDGSIVQRVDEVNALASQIARLNGEISQVLSVGDQPNDLLDERDRMLDRLAEISGAFSHLQENGEVLVSIGGHALVVGHTAFGLSASRDPANENLIRVDWSDGQAFQAVTGELAGLFEARDGVIQTALDGLDDLAGALITRLNALHRTGYGLNNATGLDFFTGTDALSIRLNSALDNPANLATASAIDSPGDGSLAALMAGVRDELLLDGGSATANQFYTSQIALLGLQVERAQANARDRGLVADTLATQRESLTGVSLDEEAANLVKFQRAYQAAARMLTALDEMLDRVINGTGRVGL